eukprot:EG_transcript_46246
MSSLGPLPDIFGPADPSIQDPQKWKTDFAMCLSVPNPDNIKKHGAAVVESKEVPTQPAAVSPAMEDTTMHRTLAPLNRLKPLDATYVAKAKASAAELAR